MKTFGKYLEEKNKGLWDNIHAKRKRGEKMRKPGSKGAPTDADFERSQKESVAEKKLTPAEMKKREEIAKAMERDNPGMDMKKKMAIATATAKKVAEETSLDEGIENMSHARLKWHMNTGVPHGSYTKAELKKERDDRLSKVDTHAAYKKAKPSMNEESLDITEISLDMLTKKISNSGMATTKKANKMDKTKKDLEAMKARLAGKPALAKEATEVSELSKKTLGSYVKKASRDVANRSADNARDYARGDRPVGLNKKAMKNWRREIGIDKAVDKMTQEAVQSADKKPAKYIKPDGKVGIRMVRVDKKVVDKDA